MKTYFINEIFYSLQGEGVRSGTGNIFVRFGKCNLKCKKEVEGFDCDTEFESGRLMSPDEILSFARELSKDCPWIIFTGGEPSLQLNDELIDFFKQNGFKLAIETNGTREISSKIDWICVSPKTAEHAIRQRKAHEVKYVRAYGQGIPQTVVEADHYLISPAFEGPTLNEKISSGASNSFAKIQNGNYLFSNTKCGAFVKGFSRRVQAIVHALSEEY